MRLGCWILTWATSAMVMTGGAVHGQAQTPDNQKDYSFLNDLHGKQAMEWVQHQNHKTLSILEKDYRFKGFYKNTLAALQAQIECRCHSYRLVVFGIFGKTRTTRMGYGGLHRTVLIFLKPLSGRVSSI